MQSFVNTVRFDKSFVLVLGRKRQVIKEPARLEMQQDIKPLYNDPLGPQIVVGESLKLFIAGKLFSTSIVAPRKRYSRYAARLVKPKRKRPELHLTKKLTQLAA